MKKLKTCFGYGILFFFLSCSQDGLSPSDNCLGELDDTIPVWCENVENAGKICDYRYLGQFRLTDETKQYLPMYCMEPGEKITYANQLGEVQEFEIISKAYLESHSFMNRGVECPDDSTKVLLDCLDHEMAYIKIRSPHLTFLISLVTNPDDQNSDPDKVGDFLIISREEVKDYFVDEWKMVVDRRTLSYAVAPCMKIYGTMELNGKMYQDVTAFDEQAECEKYRYFVNREFGLIGFSRADGILFSLK